MDIHLKPLGLEDIEMVRNWRNSEIVSQYMYTEVYISQEDQKKWFTYIKNDPKSIYWIIQYNNKDIGLVSITNIDSALNSCFWAFYLGDTAIRGSGIGSKVEYRIIEYVFDVLKLNKLRCEVFVSNERVIKMHEKFGFRREAYYREHCIKKEQKIDVVGLGLLKSEWNLIKDFHKKRIYA